MTRGAFRALLAAGALRETRTGDELVIKCGRCGWCRLATLRGPTAETRRVARADGCHHVLQAHPADYDAAIAAEVAR